jgi:CheY-like chemotaxis protein
LLTVIGGYSELIMLELAPDDPKRVDVAEVKKSADRAGDLTRQLLAFSRRQVLQPRILDLNQVVEDLTKLLRRLIVESIELKTSLDSSLGRVKADPAQIEQILVNLAVNARDAMPAGGTLTIETGNVDLDERYIKNHPRVEAGRYAMLAVSDTGHGIPKDIQTRIFEPFFTTKPPGSGTGLGLSTVYGIVKQSGGYIWVYSESGLGTSFKIYLPLVDAVESATFEREERSDGTLRRPSSEHPETILLVEDDEMVRILARRVLGEQGYDVIEARDGAEASSLCQNHPGPIHLMLSDVVLPGQSGPQTADELRCSRPDMKLLYMSGYTENRTVRDMLASDVPFLQKPFSAGGLARKVRKVLDG